VGELTFPQTLPTLGTVGVSFEPEEVAFLSPEAGGTIGAVTAGFPRWVLRASLGQMTFAQADIWRAWLAVQRGPQRPFFAYDMDRQHPRFHGKSRPYQPAPATWSQAIRPDGLAVLTLGGLLAGQVVSIGDYVGLIWSGGKLALTRAVETRGADGSGSVSVAVEPPIPPVVPADAAATLRRAGCLMRLVPGETKLGEAGITHFSAGTTIVAVQDLIR